jgi:hypothetical protein
MVQTKAIIVLTALLLVSSCATEKRCLEKWPPLLVIKDSVIVRVNTIYRDTVIFIKLPPDTIRVEQNIDSLMNPLIAESKYAKAVADIYKNRLRLTLTQFDTIIQFKLDSANRVTLFWKEMWETEKQTVIVKDRYTPVINKFFTPIGILVCVCILIFVLVKAIKI